MASDTTPSARAAQLVVARRLGPEGRLRVAAELSEDIRRVSIEGVRRRNPTYTYEQARRVVMSALWGVQLSERVWPTAEP
ncbi:MAG TPA: hypothetical protein VGF76_27090 [Polyangiaceae bacterium]